MLGICQQTRITTKMYNTSILFKVYGRMLSAVSVAMPNAVKMVTRTMMTMTGTTG